MGLLAIYRYEPWKDFRFDGGKYGGYHVKHPYWISEGGMDPDNVPTPEEHRNVKPIPYPTSPVRLGDFVADHINQYLRGKGKNREVIDPVYGINSYWSG